MRRVASRRVVLVTMDVEVLGELWVVRDYLPETLTAHAAGFPPIARLTELLPGASTTVIPVPRECIDDCVAAFWGRLEAYLDPCVRAAISPWHQLPPAAVTRTLDRLRRDLSDGWRDRRYGHLRQQAELGVGLRLVSAEMRSTPPVTLPAEITTVGTGARRQTPQSAHGRGC